MHNLYINIIIFLICCFLFLKYLNFLIMKRRRDVLQVSKEMYVDGPRDIFYENLFLDIEENSTITNSVLINFLDKNLEIFKKNALEEKDKLIKDNTINNENFIDQNFKNEEIQVLFMYAYSIGEILELKKFIKANNSEVLSYRKTDLLLLKDKVNSPSISSFYEGKNFLIK